jgi:hypothetical protein
MRVNLRLLLAGLYVPCRMRARELEELFARTAAAFGRPVPPAGRPLRPRLREYALFTRDRAGEALARGGDLSALERRLYRAAAGLGRRYRVRLGLRSAAEAMAAARLIYRGLGIDFRGTAGGEVTVRRCAFSTVYSPAVCRLVSALDRGLLAGLSGGGDLRFSQRITEGAACCRAVLAREVS